MNEPLAELKLPQHPDKSFIGQLSRGSNFLGYLFPSAELGVAPSAVERVSRLYERAADLVRINAYVPRWWRWASSGPGALGADLTGAAAGCNEKGADHSRAARARFALACACRVARNALVVRNRRRPTAAAKRQSVSRVCRSSDSPQ